MRQAQKACRTKVQEPLFVRGSGLYYPFWAEIATSRTAFAMGKALGFCLAPKALQAPLAGGGDDAPCPCRRRMGRGRCRVFVSFPSPGSAVENARLSSVLNALARIICRAIRRFVFLRVFCAQKLKACAQVPQIVGVGKGTVKGHKDGGCRDELGSFCFLQEVHEASNPPFPPAGSLKTA